MCDLSLIQQYWLCAVNPKGALYSTDFPATTCLIAAGLLDLLLAGCVTLEDKRVYVLAPLPEALDFLAPLYHALDREKPMKLSRLLERYTILTGKPLKTLLSSVLSTLVAAGLTTPVTAGLFKNQERQAPKEEAVDRVMEQIRAELLEDGPLTEDVVALTALLDKAGRLKDFFSKHEQKRLRERLREIQSSETGQTIKDMVNYVELMSIILITSAGSSGG